MTPSVLDHCLVSTSGPSLRVFQYFIRFKFSQSARKSACSAADLDSIQIPRSKSVTPKSTVHSLKHINHILPTVYTPKKMAGRPSSSEGSIFFATGNMNKIREVCTTCWLSQPHIAPPPPCTTAGSCPCMMSNTMFIKPTCSTDISRADLERGMHDPNRCASAPPPPGGCLRDQGMSQGL